MLLKCIIEVIIMLKPNNQSQILRHVSKLVHILIEPDQIHSGFSKH